MIPGGGQPIRRAGLGLAVAVGSALLLVGCGQPAVTNVPGQPSSTAPAASAEASSACALVPDMDTIVGKVATVAPAEYQTNSLSRCTWVYATNPTRHVALNFGPASGHTDSITSFGQGEVVPGLGDDARWWAGTRTLSVAVGPKSFQINLELAPADVSKDLAVAIARSAVGRVH